MIAPGLARHCAGTTPAALAATARLAIRRIEAFEQPLDYGAGETEMQGGIPSKASVGERIVTELTEFVIIAVYLYVCFAALAYLKSAILHAHDIPFTPFGFAAVKALICAKFVLLGRALHMGERFNALPLIWPTLYKSLVFLVLLLILNALEEVVVGVMHHRHVTDSLAEFGGGTLDQLIATSVVMLLILVPFFAFRSLGEVVGERNLVGVFFRPRRSIDAA